MKFKGDRWQCGPLHWKRLATTDVEYYIFSHTFNVLHMFLTHGSVLYSVWYGLWNRTLYEKLNLQFCKVWCVEWSVVCVQWRKTPRTVKDISKFVFFFPKSLSCVKLVNASVTVCMGRCLICVILCTNVQQWNWNKQCSWLKSYPCIGTVLPFSFMWMWWTQAQYNIMLIKDRGSSPQTIPNLPIT